MKNPYSKDFIPFFDEDFNIVSPFKSFEDNIKALQNANISSRQMKLELELLESYRVNKVLERYTVNDKKDVNNHAPIRIIMAHPSDDFKLYLAFSNRDIKIFDMAPLIGPDSSFSLKNRSVFNKLYNDSDKVVWDNGFSVDKETLYKDSVPLRDRTNYRGNHRRLHINRTTNLTVDLTNELKEN